MDFKYGGTDYAAHVKGMEMAAYDPRAGWGQGLNYAVANRGGCHLNAYPISLEALFKFIPPYTTVSKAAWVDYNENLFSAVNSIQTCQFTTYGFMLEPLIPKYTPKPFLKMAMFLLPRVAQMLLDLSALSGLMTAITGRKLTQRTMLLAGKRIHVLERHMNCLMGISSKDDTLPNRFLTEAETKHPDKKVVNLDPMIKQYYRIKGYGKDGIPKEQTLLKLGIDNPVGK
ncbi:MAG: aldehyde ferredoxin oxidoreductase C-terminal domain-containing protein [Spirochaetales bacterium]|nr:aldehyde ferredoxin oxidoreductase C-terminal domain-containing protein [Spirochaetales bacterium]